LPLVGALKYLNKLNKVEG